MLNQVLLVGKLGYIETPRHKKPYKILTISLDENVAKVRVSNLILKRFEPTRNMTIGIKGHVVNEAEDMILVADKLTLITSEVE